MRHLEKDQQIRRDEARREAARDAGRVCSRCGEVIDFDEFSDDLCSYCENQMDPSRDD